MMTTKSWINLLLYRVHFLLRPPPEERTLMPKQMEDISATTAINTIVRFVAVLVTSYVVTDVLQSITGPASPSAVLHGSPWRMMKIHGIAPSASRRKSLAQVLLLLRQPQQRLPRRRPPPLPEAKRKTGRPASKAAWTVTSLLKVVASNLVQNAETTYIIRRAVPRLHRPASEALSALHALR